MATSIASAFGIFLRIAALFVIFLGATAAWVILGTTLVVRTQHSDSAQRAQLGALWGPKQTQCAPGFSFVAGNVEQILPIDASNIDVNLLLDQRRKGLLWYNTYRVNFLGSYLVTNTSRARQLTFALSLPAKKAVYDDMHVVVNGRPIATSIADGVVRAMIPVAPGRSA